MVGAKKSRSLRVARRKIFVTRALAKCLTGPIREEAKIPYPLVNKLKHCQCKAPVNLQVTSNKINGTISISTIPNTDAGQYSKYGEQMREALNEILAEDELKYLSFSRVPTDVSLMVHGIFYNTVPDNKAHLSEEVKEQFRTLYKVGVTSPRFLKEEPKTMTPEKKAGSIILRLSEADAEECEPRFLFMGKYKEAKIMWHPTSTTQCTRCQKYGHPKVGCKETTDICPVCSLKQRGEDHKWHRTACRGHKKLILNCCDMTPAKCPLQRQRLCEGHENTPRGRGLRPKRSLSMITEWLPWPALACLTPKISPVGRNGGKPKRRKNKRSENKSSKT